MNIQLEKKKLKFWCIRSNDKSMAHSTGDRCSTREIALFFTSPTSRQQRYETNMLRKFSVSAYHV